MKEMQSGKVPTYPVYGYMGQDSLHRVQGAFFIYKVGRKLLQHRIVPNLNTWVISRRCFYYSDKISE